MAHRVVFAPEARDQLIAVYDRVATRASPDTAYAFTTAIMGHCESFATFPHRGTRRDDLRPGLRVIGFRRRVTIAFSVDEAVVTILGIFYGGQDYEGAFESEA